MGVQRDNIALGLRAHTVGKHIIFYRVTEHLLVIVRVLHQGMDPERHLGSNSDLS